MFLIYRFSIMFTFAVSTFVFQYPPRYCFVVSQRNAFDFTAIQSCLRLPFLFSFFNIRFRCCCCCLAIPLATSRLLPRKRKSQMPFRESQFVITWCFTRIRLDLGRILINFRLLSFNNNKKSRSLILCAFYRYYNIHNMTKHFFNLRIYRTNNVQSGLSYPINLNKQLLRD